MENPKLKIISEGFDRDSLRPKWVTVDINHYEECMQLAEELDIRAGMFRAEAYNLHRGRAKPKPPLGKIRVFD